MQKLLFILIYIISFQSLAEDQIIDVITNLNGQNEGLVINIDELLSSDENPEKADKVNKVDKKESQITVPSPKIIEKNPSVQAPQKIETEITSPKPLAIPKPVKTIVPKVPELIKKDNKVENLDEIILPNETKDKPSAVPNESKNINLSPILQKNTKDNLEFEGLLKPSISSKQINLPQENKEKTTKDKKSSKQNKTEAQTPSYQIIIDPENLWKDSFMFTIAEQKEMKTSIMNFMYGVSEIQNTTKKTETVNRAKSNFTVSLKSILYINNSNWSVWINDQKLSSKDERQKNSPFRILSVNNDKITVELTLNDNMELPDMLTLHQDNNFVSIPVNYRIGDKIVKFDLAPNQVFHTKTMTINDR